MKSFLKKPFTRENAIKGMHRLAVLGVAAASSKLMASPFGAAVGTATTETQTAAATAGAAAGAIVTVIGGCYAGWEAVHSRLFTTPLVCAIAGAVIAGVCVI